MVACTPNYHSARWWLARQIIILSEGVLARQIIILSEGVLAHFFVILSLAKNLVFFSFAALVMTRCIYDEIK